jgi:hypothetical protein
MAIVMIGGVLAMLVSLIWVVVIAFKDSIGWGIGCLLSPVALIYVLTHRKRCKRPLIVFGVGFALYAISLILELSR